MAAEHLPADCAPLRRHRFFPVQRACSAFGNSRGNLSRTSSLLWPDRRARVDGLGDAEAGRHHEADQGKVTPGVEISAGANLHQQLQLVRAEDIRRRGIGLRDDDPFQRVAGFWAYDQSSGLSDVNAVLAASLGVDAESTVR